MRSTTSGALGGLVLTPGLYKWASGVTLGSTLTISGTALDSALHMSYSSPPSRILTELFPAWIFQITGTFNIAAGQRVVLLGGALAKNIVWVVAGAVDFGAAAHLEGVLLGKTAVTLQTGTSVNGRILAQTFVSLQKATVVAPV